MYIDSLLLLDDAVALSATAYSTNTIDLGNVTPKREVGSGEALAVVFQIDTAADTASGDETYQFLIVQSANANLSSHDTLIQTDTSFITRSTLVAGYTLALLVPPLVSKRYLGVRYVLGGTTPTVTLTAWYGPWKFVQKFTTYAKGYTIS